MYRVMYREGMLVLLDPPSPEWTDGRVFGVEEKEYPSKELTAAEQDELWERLLNAVGRFDEAEFRRFQSVLAENDRLEKERMARKMGLAQ